MKYYCTSSAIEKWLPCEATTLRGAKRETTRRLGGGLLDNILLVGEPEFDHPDSQIVAVAAKSERGGRWS